MAYLHKNEPTNNQTVMLCPCVILICLLKACIPMVGVDLHICNRNESSFSWCIYLKWYQDLLKQCKSFGAWPVISQNTYNRHTLIHLLIWGMIPDSKVHGANTGPIRGRQVPGGPHVGPMNSAIWDVSSRIQSLNSFLSSSYLCFVHKSIIPYCMRDQINCTSSI